MAGVATAAAVADAGVVAARRIVVGGGTGFVGTALVSSLRGAGHDVHVISRSGSLTWDSIRDQGLPEDTDAVINLAGLGIFSFRLWTESFRSELYSSRIDSNKVLVNAIAAARTKPSVFVSTSAVGYYRPDGATTYTEESEPGNDDFASRLCVAVEASSQLPEETGVRHVINRIGIVLGDGGALNQMLLPFKLGLGGILGTGKQPFPWVALEDVVGLIEYELENTDIEGPVNAVAPEMISNYEYTKALGSVLNRPTVIPVFAWILNLVMGADRAALLLEGQKVVPAKATEAGYAFKFTDIKSVLESILKK